MATPCKQTKNCERTNHSFQNQHGNRKTEAKHSDQRKGRLQVYKKNNFTTESKT